MVKPNLGFCYTLMFIQLISNNQILNLLILDLRNSVEIFAAERLSGIARTQDKLQEIQREQPQNIKYQVKPDK